MTEDSQYYPTLRQPPQPETTAPRAPMSPNAIWAIAIAATLAVGMAGATGFYLGLVLFLPMLPLGVGFGIYFLIVRNRLRKRVEADLYDEKVAVPRYERTEKFQSFLQAFWFTLQSALLLLLLSMIPWFADQLLGTQFYGGNSDDAFFSMLPTAAAILSLSIATIVTSLRYFRSVPIAAGEQYALATNAPSAKLIRVSRVLNTVTIIAYFAATLPLLISWGVSALGSS